MWLDFWRALLFLGWIIALIFAGVGGSIAFSGFTMSASAPQQAAAAAMGVAAAVIPYVVMRGLDLMFKPWPQRAWFGRRREFAEADLRAAVEAELDRRLRARQTAPAGSE